MTRFSDLLGSEDDPPTPPASATAPVPPTPPPRAQAGADSAPEPPAGAGPPELTDATDGARHDAGAFARLAREQADAAVAEDEQTERLRALGLDGLPPVDDDLLPRG